MWFNNSIFFSATYRRGDQTHNLWKIYVNYCRTILVLINNLDYSFIYTEITQYLLKGIDHIIKYIIKYY